MSKYWKHLDWIIGGIVTIFYLYAPMLFEQYSYSSPYKIPIIVVVVFLIYCFLSGIYWMMNKKLNMVFHYCLIIGIYLLATITIMVIAAYKG